MLHDPAKFKRITEKIMQEITVNYRVELTEFQHWNIFHMIKNALELAAIEHATEAFRDHEAKGHKL